MAQNSKLAVAYRNAALDSTLAAAANGFIDVYDGVQSADADTAVATQNLLVRFPLSATPFGASSGGVATAAAIAAATITASGAPAWYRLTDLAHGAILDGSAGTSGANLNFAASPFVAGASATITSYTETFPA